ncbi:unnamed protein product [Prorocentrum cordatum]|uniref:HTH OST-type domain-containing protein n=1 Tax=Prorocentrum cordatum TaxID=2364126 RepID=A0ABN9XYR8_9DINO|nr:unnamed protein product [Polarella glacialis]
MPFHAPADSVLALRPEETPHGGAEQVEHSGGPQHLGTLSECLLRFPAGPPEEGPVPPESSASEAEEQRPAGRHERPRGAAAVVYHGRVSHPRLGANIPVQLELWSAGRRARGVWFMLGRSVDAVAEGKGKWPLSVRTVGGVTSATLWGKEVAPRCFAGEFSFGGDGGGSFELLQCLQVSLSAESADWGSSSHSGSLSADSLDSLDAPAMNMKEPIGYYGNKLAVQSSGRPADEVDSKLIFTSEEHLAQALVEVLRVHPNGVDLAQLKQVIHRSSGRWVSEALLGYKKLRDLIRSPTMSQACWFQSNGSCCRVFGYSAYAPAAVAATRGRCPPGLEGP